MYDEQTKAEQDFIRRRQMEHQLNAQSIAGACGPETAPASQWRSQVERLTLDNVDSAFQYQPWHPGQVDRGNQVREALVAAAKVILRTVPDCPQRTRVLNHLIDARMIANAAITFEGRF